MANSTRRKAYTDRSGNMFLPMNVEGGTWNEHFLTTPKVACIIGIILAFISIIIYLSSEDVQASLFGYVFYLTIWAILSTLILRFIVFEEKFYYRMYKKLEEHEITTPAIFWDIVAIHDTPEGAIMTYSDARIGIVVKLDRDTITGKSVDFQETHYDAISDFYRAVAENNYSFVQMNIMETAGKDPRLNEVSKLLRKSKNERVCKLMELEIGHIKNMTNKSLYESDYFVFYTKDLQKLDTIIEDLQECLFKLIDGAYTGYTFLSQKEIVDLVKELYGVNYFNSTDASLKMFEDIGSFGVVPFTVDSLVWTDGNVQKLSKSEITKLRTLTSSVLSGAKNSYDIALKDTFYKVDSNNKIGIDLDEIVGVTDEDDDNMIDFGDSDDEN